MGCFLGCLGGEKNHKRREQRTKRASTRIQRNKIQNVHHETVSTVEKTIAEAPPNILVAELSNKSVDEEKLSPSPRKRVAFNLNVTTYEHVLVNESIDSLLECNKDVGIENQGDLKRKSPLPSLSEADGLVISTVGSYPPNHRYHNARDSDDEAEAYGHSDMDDFDEYYYDDYDEHIDHETFLTSSKEPKRENSAAEAINEEVKSCSTPKIQPSDSARDGSDHIDSVLNPIENITQLKAVKSRRTHPSEQQKKSTTNYEAPRVSVSSIPTRQASLSLKSRSDYHKNEIQEIAVDASLANWLDSPEIMLKKITSSSGLDDTQASGNITSQDSSALKNFEDRPILGALTVEELRQISATPSPRKSTSRSPDEIPIISSVGTYWNH